MTGFFKFLAMKRKNEIFTILKAKLAELNDAINKNHYSDNFEDVILSSQKTVAISKEIDEYLIELNSL